MNEYKWKLLAQIEADIAEGKLAHKIGAMMIRYIMQFEGE